MNAQVEAVAERDRKVSTIQDVKRRLSDCITRLDKIIAKISPPAITTAASPLLFQTFTPPQKSPPALLFD